jgi:hypothetical protein
MNVVGKFACFVTGLANLMVAAARWLVAKIVMAKVLFAFVTNLRRILLWKFDSNGVLNDGRLA